MKYAHSIDMRVFSKEGDDEKLVIEKVNGLYPFSLHDEKISINEKTALGFDDKKINIITVSLKKERHINAFIRHLMSRLGDVGKNILLSQLESRLDSSLHFYIRLDKDRLLHEDCFIVTDSGNCFHFTLAIAAYPHKREVAIEKIREMLYL